MSTTVAGAPRRAPLAPAQAPASTPPSRLEIVPTRRQRRARPRTVFALLSIAVVIVIVVAQLLLSVAVAQGAFQLNSLQGTTKVLQRSAQVASEDLDRVRSPQYLAENANALGMVTDSTPAYLRLSDGAVLGSPQAASAAAGTVTGSAGNLVPNSLLAGVPLVNPHADASRSHAGDTQKTSGAQSTTSAQGGDGPAGTTGETGNSASTSASAAGSGGSTVPLDGALPTPVTH